MKHVLAVTFLVCPAMLWAGAPANAGPATGLWKIDGEVHGRPVNMICQLTETDQKLSGICSRGTEGFAPHTIDGTMKGQKLQFHLQTDLGANSITLIVNGRLNEDGSRLSGDLEVEPMGVGGKFEGERTTEASGSVAAQHAPASTAEQSTRPEAKSSTNSTPDASGRWKVDADFQGTPAVLTCVFIQKQQALSGTCTGEDNKANPLVGEVTDRSVKWHFDAEYQAQAIQVSLTGTLSSDGTSMRGDASVAPLNADGTFTASRQPAAALTPATAPNAETHPTQ